MDTSHPPGSFTIYKSPNSYLTHIDNCPVLGATKTSWTVKSHGDEQEGPFTFSIPFPQSSSLPLALTLDPPPASGDGSRGISLKPLEHPAPDTQLWKLENVATRALIVPGTSSQIKSVAEDHLMIAEEILESADTRRVRAYPDMGGMETDRWTFSFP